MVNFVNYTYYVTAVNLAGAGSKSNIINATPAPPRYKITFHIIPSSGGKIVLDSNAYANNSSDYVYKGTHKILARPYYGYLFVRWDCLECGGFGWQFPSSWLRLQLLFICISLEVGMTKRSI